LPAAAVTKLVARQRLLRALLSTLGDDAAAGTKLLGLHAIRLLLAAFTTDGAAAGGKPDDTISTGSKRRGDGSGGSGNKGGSGHEVVAPAPAAALPEEDWAAAAKKLGKRLEDGDDEVRIAACGALAALARCRVAGAGLSARQCADAKADDAALSSRASQPPTHASPEGTGGGRNGSSEQDAAGLAAVEKLLSSLRLHACDDNPAVAAAAAAVVQQLQSSQLVSQPP
jgi:hypothetical protein